MRAPLRFRAVRTILRAGLAAVLPIEASGLEHVPDRPYVLSCNHLNWIDPFVLLAALPAAPRLHFLGLRSAIYNRRWKRWTLELMGGVIPVESGDIAHVAEQVARALRSGGAVGIFPEGGIGPAEGALRPLRRGVAHFALEGGVPVVPVALSGTQTLWRGKRLRLVVGRPILLGGDIAADMAAIERAMRAVLPAYEEVAGARPWPWLTGLLK